MIVDWFTIIAQVVNFLILIWLMKRFLYKPIRRAIDEREKKIEAKIVEADKKKLEAQNESDDFKRKNEDFDQQHEMLLKKATEDAESRREQHLNEAENAVAALTKKRQESLKSEEEKFIKSLSVRIQREVFLVSKKALTDLSGAALEEQIINQLINQLSKLGDKEKNVLNSSFHKSPGSIKVRTGFSLSEKVRANIEKEVVSYLIPQATESDSEQVKFEMSKDLICGIEVEAHGQRVSWNLSDYLDSVQQEVQELLTENNSTKIQRNSNTEETLPEVGSP